MNNFISMHTFQAEPIDCRLMQLEFHFSRITKKQLKDLSLYCIFECKKILDDAFFLEWHCGNSRIKEATLISKLKGQDNVFDFDFHGNVMSSFINNSKSLDKYNSNLFRHLNTSGASSSFSVDYWEAYRALFQGISEPEEICKNVLRLFTAEGKYFKQKWFGEDVVGHMFTCPYSNNSDLYYGHFDFRIALLCLGENAIPFSEKLISFLVRTTDIVADISGRIALSPTKPPSSSSAYMHYFGGGPSYCPLGREAYMREHEWINSCFLKGVEWYNLLSPFQTKRIQQSEYPEEIIFIKLSNGGSIVTVPNNIKQVNISDLRSIKKFLYPILYPGGIEIPINALLDMKNISYVAKPRHQWESVPILECEISAIKDRVIIRYKTGDGLSEPF